MSRGSLRGDYWSSLFAPLKELRSAWPAHGWSWDSRLSCVTSSFDVEYVDRARTAAAAVLTVEWTSATLPRAPSAVREIAERSGGLRTGQLVFASSATEAAFVYGLWWPWANRRTISMRIGLGGPEPGADILEKLRDGFGVEL